MQQNLMLGDPLSLDRIRSMLVRLEDTIIFKLIERAQFAHNPRIYERGGMEELRAMGFEGSWLDWFLKEMETFQAKARRYTSPDEYPFTPASELPAPLLPQPSYPSLLHPNSISVNASIKTLYIRSIVPRITKASTLLLASARRAQGITGEAEYEDAGNYGSAATVDVEVLQALSKRVHYGKFVSESKFRAHPEEFVPYIRSGDREKLEEMITKPEVERRLLGRVRRKARLYGQEVDEDGNPVVVSANAKPDEDKEAADGKIDVEGVVELYERYIIPLTKEVEESIIEIYFCARAFFLTCILIMQVDYLLKRLDGLSQEEIDELCSKKTEQDK